MAQIFSNNDKDNLMLMEMANRELKEDLKRCLILISSMKPYSLNLAKYETKKKLLVEIIDTEHSFVQKIKLVS